MADENDTRAAGASEDAAALVNSLKKVSYLTFFEIPLLTHLRDESGRDYLDHWCDSVGDTDRRLVFRVTPEDLNLYLAGRKTLRELVLNPADGFYYMVDGILGVPVTGDKISIEYPNTIDESYTPSPDSYHDPGDAR